MNAADMVELRRLDSAIPFFLLMGMGDDADRCAQGEDGSRAGIGDMMDFGLLHSVLSREELPAPRHVHRAPVVRLARSIASIDDCDAYHNSVLEGRLAAVDGSSWLPRSGEAGERIDLQRGGSVSSSSHEDEVSCVA